MRPWLFLLAVCTLAVPPSGCDTVPACEDPTCPGYVGYLSTDLFVLNVMPSGVTEHRIEVERGERMTLIPGTSLVALRARFVDVHTGQSHASFRPIEEARSGVYGGFVVEERWGGDLRAPYRNILVRTIPDHGTEALRSALTFVGIDGREQILAGDTLRFVSSATFVRTRHEMPRGERAVPAVLVVRTSEACSLVFDNYDILSSQACDITDRGLWRFPTDGSTPQRLADLPRSGTVAVHAPSADRRHDLVVLDTGTGAMAVRVDLVTGAIDVHEGVPLTTMGLLPDGVTAFGYDSRLSVLLNMATGERRTEGRAAIAFSAQTMVHPLGAVADSGLVALGWDSQHGAVGVVTVPVPAPPGETGLVRRLVRDETYGGSDVYTRLVQGGVTNDGTRYAMLVERHRVHVYYE